MMPSHTDLYTRHVDTNSHLALGWDRIFFTSTRFSLVSVSKILVGSTKQIN